MSQLSSRSLLHLVTGVCLLQFLVLIHLNVAVAVYHRCSPDSVFDWMKFLVGLNPIRHNLVLCQDRLYETAAFHRVHSNSLKSEFTIRGTLVVRRTLVVCRTVPYSSSRNRIFSSRI